MALLPLVQLANVEQQRPVGVVQPLEHVGRGDLVDLLLDLRQKLSVRRHYFQEYSVPAQGQRLPDDGLSPATIIASG